MEQTSQTLDTRLFHDVFNASPIGIAVENLEGQPLFVNPALCAMLGFSDQELRSKHCAQFSPPEDAEKDFALFQQLRAGSISRYQMEKRYFRRDGSLVWGRLSIYLLNSFSIPLVIALVEEIADKKAEEDALTRKLIASQEQERARIGRELHDDINQRLALLAVELERLQDGPSELRTRVQELRKQLIEISNDVQNLSHGLYSSKLEYLGALRAMKGWCREFSERQGIQIEFKSPDAEISPPQEIGLCLFRVLQEALSNAARHSGARRIDVEVRVGSGEIHLFVSDSGRGFDLETAVQGRGLGLTTMQERVRLINGSIEIQSKLTRGTIVHVRVPFTPEPGSRAFEAPTKS